MKNILSVLILLGAGQLIASESIGQYSKGSLRDSLSLDRNDYGFQHVRRSRDAFHGHDHMVEFLKDISSESFSKGTGQLLVSDISSDHGGALSGHASHQIGLDVDIWFWRPDDSETDLPDDVRENKSAPIYLDPATNKFVTNRTWDSRLDRVLQDVASDSRVARIFVNPGVKKRLCTLFPNQKWLKKIRPWWRHHEHFHVRLNCPKDSPKCVAQSAPATIDCDSAEFNWWFSEDFKREYRRRYGQAIKSGEFPICDAP